MVAREYFDSLSRSISVSRRATLMTWSRCCIYELCLGVKSVMQLHFQHSNLVICMTHVDEQVLVCPLVILDSRCFPRPLNAIAMLARLSKSTCSS